MNRRTFLTTAAGAGAALVAAPRTLEYEDFRGHKLDRKMMELLLAH